MYLFSCFNKKTIVKQASFNARFEDGGHHGMSDGLPSLIKQPKGFAENRIRLAVWTWHLQAKWTKWTQCGILLTYCLIQPLSSTSLLPVWPTILKFYHFSMCPKMLSWATFIIIIIIIIIIVVITWTRTNLINRKIKEILNYLY